MWPLEGPRADEPTNFEDRSGNARHLSVAGPYGWEQDRFASRNGALGLKLADGSCPDGRPGGPYRRLVLGRRMGLARRADRHPHGGVPSAPFGRASGSSTSRDQPPAGGDAAERRRRRAAGRGELAGRAGGRYLDACRSGLRPIRRRRCRFYVDGEPQATAATWRSHRARRRPADHWLRRVHRWPALQLSWAASSTTSASGPPRSTPTSSAPSPTPDRELSMSQRSFFSPARRGFALRRGGPHGHLAPDISRCSGAVRANGGRRRRGEDLPARAGVAGRCRLTVAWTGPAKGRWPSAGSVEMKLAGRVPGRVGEGRVNPGARQGSTRVSRRRTGCGSPRCPRSSPQAGLSGPVITVEGTSQATCTRGSTSTASLTCTAAAGRAGLNLAQLPACAATAPERTECQEATPLHAQKSRSTPVRDAVGVVRASSVVAWQKTPSRAKVTTRPATCRRPVPGRRGMSSGAFNYANAIKLPPTQGPTPEIALDYSSQMVDGRMAGNNNQASWAGDGWDYSPGSYRAHLRHLCRRPGEGRRQGSEQQGQEDRRPVLEGQVAEHHGLPGRYQRHAGQGRRDRQVGPPQDADWKVEYAGAVADKDPRRRSAGSSPRRTARGTTSPARSPPRIRGGRFRCSATTPASLPRGRVQGLLLSQAWRWLLDKEIDVTAT